MPLVAPTDREFRLLERGYIRDKVILANFRAGLRQLVNPRTGQLFTEEEIARATQPGSRWFIGAQAIDDFGQVRQRNALWLADQVRLERASTRWLRKFHGKPRGLENPLPATGASGVVKQTATPGTIITGSTDLGNPGAYTARDPDGNRYQVFQTETADANGEALVTMAAIDTGKSTNIKAGTVLTWITRDPNMDKSCSVPDGEQFTGGTDQETDQEHAARIASVIRHKPAAGNSAQVNAWGRAASNAIAEAFVYPCAFRSGSELVSIVAKRAGNSGPTARQPSTSTLADAITYLTPPLSPVKPEKGFVLVTDQTLEESDLVLRLAMPRGSDAGWADVQPFPSYHATTPTITSKTSDTDFEITCLGDSTLPGQSAGATMTAPDVPSLMAWNESTSRFTSLPVSSIQDLGSNVYRVQLSGTAGTRTIGEVICPDTERRDIVAEAIEEYFDGLGTGELFASDDSRFARGQRFPEVGDEQHYRAGGEVATRVIDALGGSTGDASLASISKSEPSLPTDLLSGPNLLVLGKVGIYRL